LLHPDAVVNPADAASFAKVVPVKFAEPVTWAKPTPASSIDSLSIMTDFIAGDVSM
jgi:hypothetical protein